MSDSGLTTPVQPVRAGENRGRGVVTAGLALLVVVGVLAWHPWVGEPGVPPIGLASVAPSSPPSDDGSQLDPGLLGGPMTGPWSGTVAAKWSIVAFLRAHPVSSDPLDMQQQEVTVFLGPVHPPISRAPEYCDTVGPTRELSAAELPTGEVLFLGIAYPAVRTVTVDGVVRLGEDIGAIPVELGWIPGVGADDAGSATTSPGSDIASLDPSGTPTGDPIRMFGFPGGGPWPDGLYRFDVVTPDGPPAQLYACIRP